MFNIPKMNPNSEDKIPKIGLAGFKNIGNTCYMNSVLQLLVHCKPIISFLIDNNEKLPVFANYIERAGLKKLADKARKDNNLPEGFEINIKRSHVDNYIDNSISKQLSIIINMIIKKGNSKIVPSEFKSCVEKKIPMFKGFQQHDSHELLLQLLDNMFDETGIESDPIINNVPDIINQYLEILANTKEELIAEPDIENKKKIISKLEEFKKNNKLIINRYDGLRYMITTFKKRYNPTIYQLTSFNINIITCTECNNFNANFESNTILSLPVKGSIEECLDALIKEDEIDEYNCMSCQCKRKAIKKTQIYKTPMVLFLHLKRFRQLSNGRTLKDDRYVEIPQILDLNPYCDPNMMTEQNLSNKYVLKGISNHHGGLGGGHYTADCAGLTDPENWYNFDDSHVSIWENNNINTSDAYLLMYEMIFE